MPYPTPGFVVRQTFLEFEPQDPEETPPHPLPRSHSDSCLVNADKVPQLFGSEELRLYCEKLPGSRAEDHLDEFKRDGPILANSSSSGYVQSASFEEECSPIVPLEQRTTVTLSNLPSEYTGVLLIDTLAAEGFQNTYDFVYLPMDLRTRTSNGYALVNFRLNQDASRALVHFNGFKDWRVSSTMSCMPSWSQFIQGLPALIDRYRNSPIMHNAVPSIYKPSLFDISGKPVEFPEPTKRIRMPRLRRKSKETNNPDSDGDPCVETSDSLWAQKSDVSRGSRESGRTKTLTDDPSDGDDVWFQAKAESTVEGCTDSTRQEAQSTESTPRCEPFTSAPSPGQWVWSS